MDKKIAQKVPDVDVVVGGHTNTFLYNGEPPSNEVCRKISYQSIGKILKITSCSPDPTINSKLQIGMLTNSNKFDKSCLFFAIFCFLLQE